MFLSFIYAAMASFAAAQYNPSIYPPLLESFRMAVDMASHMGKHHARPHDWHSSLQVKPQEVPKHELVAFEVQSKSMIRRDRRHKHRRQEVIQTPDDADDATAETPDDATAATDNATAADDDAEAGATSSSDCETVCPEAASYLKAWNETHSHGGDDTLCNTGSKCLAENEFVCAEESIKTVGICAGPNGYSTQKCAEAGDDCAKGVLMEYNQESLAGRANISFMCGAARDCFVKDEDNCHIFLRNLEKPQPNSKTMFSLPQAVCNERGVGMCWDKGDDCSKGVDLLHTKDLPKEDVKWVCETGLKCFDTNPTECGAYINNTQWACDLQKCQLHGADFNRTCASEGLYLKMPGLPEGMWLLDWWKLVPYSEENEKFVCTTGLKSLDIEKEDCKVYLDKLKENKNCSSYELSADEVAGGTIMGIKKMYFFGGVAALAFILCGIGAFFAFRGGDKPSAENFGEWGEYPNDGEYYPS